VSATPAVDTLWRMADATAEFAAAWRLFQRSQSLRLAEDTLESEWTRGRSEYAAFLVRMTDADVCAYIERTLEAIGSIPGVDPYPAPYWHATVKGVGFVVDEPSGEGELSPARLAELAEAARPVIEAMPPFELRLGRPGAFAEVVIMEVLDGGAIRSLNLRLLESAPGLLRGPFDGAMFLPHVSIARFRSQEGLGELKEKLSRLRASFESLRMSGTKEASFEVREVQLIRAHLSAAAPTFAVVGAYGLGD
jgi:2'-5' RNA ligase